MFCAFEGPPNILRLYGKGYTVLRGARNGTFWPTNFSCDLQPARSLLPMLLKCKHPAGSACHTMNTLVSATMPKNGPTIRVPMALKPIRRRRTR